MAVGAAGNDVEGKIQEVGEKLVSPPASADEILPLLDQLESYLIRVDQSPSQSMLTALQPAMSALVMKELLGHSDSDVRVAVASCVSEVTRITAPDAPYSDDSMKEIFKSIVESFEKLDDFASRSFQKRVSILETVSKVRSCVVMLDLECDDLILEMFRHFLKAISLKHQEHIFNSMETIMTLVIEESEEISSDLASILLNSVKKERKEMVPVSFKLGEKVIRNCAEKLKPALINATQDDLNSYSKFVVSLCQDGSEAMEEQSDVEASAKNAVEESKMSERTVSDEQPEGSQKAADEEQEVGSTALNGEVQPSSPVGMGNRESNVVVEPSSPKQKTERSSLTSTKKASKAESSSQKEEKVDLPAGESDKRENQHEAKETESSGSQEVLSDKKEEEEPSKAQVSNNGEKPAAVTEPVSRPKRGRPPSSVKKAEVVVEGASDSEGKSLRQSRRKTGVNVGDAKQKEKSVGGKKEKDDAGDDVSLKEMVTPKADEKTSEAGGSKRKREKEKATDGKKQRNMDDSIVGARIKVWWPDDQAFYSGIIDQYDPSDKRHTIVYDDGDVEVLLLKNEKWDFAEGEDIEHSDPDTRGDTSRNKKTKTGSASQSNKRGSTKSKGPIETPKSSKSKEPAGKSAQKPKSNGSSTADKSGKRKAGRS
ncbi:hypothetical protein LUZ60_017554 [Juncus effusus]|nr:hypothetical protein LUZ60_017554 [Juncus effusus]